MTTNEFAALFRKSKDDLLKAYMTSGDTSVAIRIASLNLDATQQEEIGRILDDVLTDSYYTVLMALGGAARIGTVQQGYTILDEKGVVICRADDGELEASAWLAFQSDRT